jgi:hypothetical protein
MNDATMIDSMIKDGLTDAFHSVHMGNTAEHVAKVYIIFINEKINGIQSIIESRFIVFQGMIKTNML